MDATNTKKNVRTRGPITKPHRAPESATTLEKSAIDDKAISEAVTAEESTKSVLPGPPIPPDVQAEIRQQRQTGGHKGLPAKKQKEETR